VLAAEGAVHFAFVFAALERAAFVAERLAAAQRDGTPGYPANARAAAMTGNG
jgi:hypothetical protein